MSLTDTSPAMKRRSASAGRILGHLGGKAKFRRIQPVKGDPRLGAEQWSLGEDSVQVQARAHRFTATRKKQDGFRERYDRIAVERAPFDDFGGLSDEWEVLLDDWTAVGNVVLSPSRTTWEADLRPIRASGVSP